MKSQREPVASVSLDLDDKWTYMKTRGIAGWQEFPSYLEIVVPRILRFLEERSLRITFFLVGQDAALERNASILRSIAEAGHEIANHSFHHEPWLHLYSRSEIESELANAEQHIEAVTGRRLIGFRGPGYSVSETVADVLVSRGYRYDASTLPTFFGPPARVYYFLSAGLNAAERQRRSRLYGTWRDGLRPLKPHWWKTAGSLLEIPVTTTPIIRFPFHLSYLIWLSAYSRSVARTYLRTALALCRKGGIGPSFLLHPLDFLEQPEAPELAFFPGMQLPLARKLEMAGFALDRIASQCRIVTMEEHAATVEAETRPKEMVPITINRPQQEPAGCAAYVMPVYQAQQEFEATMESLASTSVPCSVFVVDDGSHPPLKVPQSTSRLQIHLIRLPHNQGIVRALNAGLKAALEAGFPYIARIDAGDFASPDRLARQIAYLESHPRCMLVGSDAEVCDENGTYRFTIQPPRDPRALGAALHERAWLLHSSVVYRSSVLRELGLYTDAYRAAEDYEMFLRIATRHEVGVLPEPLLTCIQRKGGISMKNARVQAISRLRIQLRYFRWTHWISYYGALSTVATLFMPRSLKAVFKARFLYSQVPQGRQKHRASVGTQ